MNPALTRVTGLDGVKVKLDMIKRFIARFRDNDQGAVTVDWVVITAGVLALGIAIMTLIETNAEALAVAAGSEIASRAE